MKAFLVILILSVLLVPAGSLCKPDVSPAISSHCLAPSSSFVHPTGDPIKLARESSHRPVTIVGEGAVQLMQDRCPEIMLPVKKADHRLTLCRLLQHRVSVSWAIRENELTARIWLKQFPNLTATTHELHRFRNKEVRDRIRFYLKYFLQEYDMEIDVSEEGEGYWTILANTKGEDSSWVRAAVEQALVFTELTFRAPSVQGDMLPEEAKKIVMPCLDQTVEVFLYHDSDEIHAWIVAGDTQKDRALEEQIRLQLKELVRAYIEQRPDMEYKGVGKRRYGKPVHWRLSIAMDKGLCEKFDGYVRQAIRSVEAQALGFAAAPVLPAKDVRSQEGELDRRATMIQALLPDDKLAIIRIPHEKPAYFLKGYGQCRDAQQVCDLLEADAQYAALVRMRDLQESLLGHPRYQDLFYLTWNGESEVVVQIFSNPECFFYQMFNGKRTGEYCRHTDFLAAFMVIQDQARKINKLQRHEARIKKCRSKPIFRFSKQGVLCGLSKQERIKTKNHYKRLIASKRPERALETRIWRLQKQTRGQGLRYIEHEGLLLVNKNWGNGKASCHQVYPLRRNNIEQVVAAAEGRVSQHYQGDSQIEEVNRALENLKATISSWKEYKALQTQIKAGLGLTIEVIEAVEPLEKRVKRLKRSVPACIRENFLPGWEICIDFEGLPAYRFSGGRAKKFARWFLLLPSRERRKILKRGFKNVFSKYKIMDWCAILPTWKNDFSELNRAMIPGFTLYIMGRAAPKTHKGIPYPNDTVKGGALQVLVIDDILAEWYTGARELRRGRDITTGGPYDRVSRTDGRYRGDDWSNLKIDNDMEDLDPWDGYVPPQEDDFLESSAVIGDSVDQAA